MIDVSLAAAARLLAVSVLVVAATPRLAPRAEGATPVAGLAGRIVFDDFEDVYAANADGSGLLRLTTDPGPEFDPDWSPDGTRIVYRDSTRGINGDDEVFVMDADGAHKTNLTRDPANDWGPAWSPDGTTIAFNSGRGEGGLPQLYVMDADGSHVRRVTEREAEYPSWSPDGTRLAFMSAEPGARGANPDYNVWVVNLDGSGLARLTDTPGEDGWPAWSPDGATIAFASTRDDCSVATGADCRRSGDIGPFFDLWLMDADGARQRRLSEAFGQFPAWSPDGRFVAFGSEGGLLVVEANGSNPRRVPIAGFSGFPGLLDWTH